MSIQPMLNRNFIPSTYYTPYLHATVSLICASGRENMDYEALKDQWSEVEDRDGIRLSWNTFPSTRMVSLVSAQLLTSTYVGPGSLPTCCAYWSPLHSLEGEAGHTPASI